VNHFQSAFTTWLNNHSSSTLRALSQESGVDSSMLSLIRKGTRQITFDAIAKLLPAIERHSSRAAAVTLLIAYLTDETPPSHSDSIRIEPVDAAGHLTADLYHDLAARWEAKGRQDPDFMAMWQGLDSYMHSPDRTTYARPTSDIALLAEPVTAYKATSGGSTTFHDTIRHDAAQEHREE
jgi:transcriptional regulator with XRE-family HTH domain